MLTNDERRIFHRMAIEADVQINHGATKLQGVCKDLCSAGMSIQLTEGHFKKGDEIEVFLDTNDNRFPPLHVEAEVLRLQEIEGISTMAIEFTAVK